MNINLRAILGNLGLLTNPYVVRIWQLWEQYEHVRISFLCKALFIPPPDKLNLQECENRDSYCFPLTLASNMHGEAHETRFHICLRGWEVGHYFWVTIFEIGNSDNHGWPFSLALFFFISSVKSHRWGFGVTTCPTKLATWFGSVLWNWWGFYRCLQ